MCACVCAYVRLCVQSQPYGFLIDFTAAGVECRREREREREVEEGWGGGGGGGEERKTSSHNSS